jgi:predicted ATPase
MKRFVLTGAHGCGKTSILLAMEALGEQIVREAGSDYQRIERARGNPFPSDRIDFAEQIGRMQLDRERRLVIHGARAFLDRALPDTLAYGAAFSWPISAELESLARASRYTAVFVVEPFGAEWEELVDARERADGARLLPQLIAIYRELGHEPIAVPPGPLDERVAFLLARADELG